METNERHTTGTRDGLAALEAGAWRMTRRGPGALLALGVPGARGASLQATPSPMAAAGNEEVEFTFADNQGIFTGLIEFPPADANPRPFGHGAGVAVAGTPRAAALPNQQVARFHGSLA